MTHSATGLVTDIFRRHTAGMWAWGAILGRENYYRGLVLIPRGGCSDFLAEKDMLLMSRLLVDLLSLRRGEMPFRSTVVADGSIIALDRDSMRDIASIRIFHRSEAFEKALLEYRLLLAPAPVAA
jgi:hypothetical protein